MSFYVIRWYQMGFRVKTRIQGKSVVVTLPEAEVKSRGIKPGQICEISDLIALKLPEFLSFVRANPLPI